MIKKAATAQPAFAGHLHQNRESLAEIFADTYLSDSAIPAVKIVHFDAEQNEVSADTMPLSTFSSTSVASD